MLTLPCQTPRLLAPPPARSPSESALQPCLCLQSRAGDQGQGKGMAVRRSGQYLRAFLAFLAGAAGCVLPCPLGRVGCASPEPSRGEAGLGCGFGVGRNQHREHKGLQGVSRSLLPTLALQLCVSHRGVWAQPELQGMQGVQHMHGCILQGEQNLRAFLLCDIQ